jgi:hypothetical protein
MKPRSFFHIGDMIQIVSGSKYAVLDPNIRISTGREQLDFVDDTFGENDSSFADTFPDECAPCIGVFGCDMRAPLQGKIFRIRLCKRTSYDVGILQWIFQRATRTGTVITFSALYFGGTEKPQP